MIDKELLDILACPACKGDVELKDNKIVCKKCGRKYPVKDGIPVMLIDEAEVEWGHNLRNEVNVSCMAEFDPALILPTALIFE